jgi:hypothetical protein
MKFATQGASNAQKDLIDALNKVTASGSSGSAQYRHRFAYLVRTLQDLAKNGMNAERGKWISTSNTSVYVYTGDPQGSQFSGNHVRVWAAVEVDASGRLIALLRVADGYHGDKIDYANYEAEALQRLQGGRIP